MTEKKLGPFDVENLRLAGEVQMIEFIRQVQQETEAARVIVDALAKRAAQLIRWHDFKG